MPTATTGRALGAAVLALGLAACGGGEDTGGDGVATGTLPVAGSSTVGPISQLVAEDFGGAAAVEITGTGGGFKDRFCAGEAAINNASRQINDAERELCTENGVTDIVELKVAVDGISVLTSVDNDTDVTCLSTSELYALVGPESGDVARWSDADALVAEIGGGVNDGLPDVPLTTAGPGTESGTYDSFYELAIEEIAEQRGQDEKFRPDWSGSNDDNVVLQGLSGNPYSFGWVGYAYYTQVQGQVRAFEVADADGECVAPTPETIASNDYPLSRDLYIYVNLAELDNPEYGQTLRDFVDYHLSEEGRALVDEVGYVQLDDETFAATQRTWTEASG